MRFTDWRILHKLLGLVGLLSLVIAAVAGAGIYGINAFDNETNQVAGTGTDSSLGAHIHQNVIALNRAEFRIAADPSAQNLDALDKEIADRKAELESQFAEAQKSADGEQAAKLAEFQKALASYLPELDKTLAKAKALGGQVTNDSARQQILDAALESRGTADQAGDAAEAYAAISKSEMEREIATAGKLSNELQITMMATAALGILGGLALGYAIAAYGIARPIAISVQRLKLLSEGDTETAILGTGRKDEIGDIAATMQVFRDNLIRNREMQAREAAEQIARAERAQRIEQLTDTFDREATSALKTVSAAAIELQATAQSMTQTAEETARQATVVSGAAEETTASVQTVAAATEELTASIQEIGTQVTESNRIVGQAVHEAEETNGKVQGLADAAQKIGDVVRIISEIAGQTNLLALNATIEAARAGEAGKGFAVVASEVKTLATQTAKATEEITGQVHAIQSATSSSASAIKGIGHTINRVSEISTTIASAVEEQGAATQEIARSVQQAAQGTQEVSTNIISVTTAAEHTGAAAAQVLEASGELSRQAEVMRGQVEKFIAGVKAA
ncbi:MAG TPA: methyl-accepting chemotaxis protein [Dongiaceae bacterium]|nr:methyl-accepting chemotaxis protein [Dongiaceae bacterium]